MDVKVILEENKTNFENQIKEYLKKGYNIQDSNFICYNDIERDLKKMITKSLQTVTEFSEIKTNPYKIIFYALLIKE